MTLKQFFKSKTFRCILVLLCIALVSGALLSICNDLLYVSLEERVNRTIKGIYGTAIGYTEVAADYATEEGKIEAVYALDDGNYLVQATGYHGYKEGSVTVWCVARYAEGAFVGLDSVSVASYEKQTLMGMFGSSVLAQYSTDAPFGDKDAVVSGATYSSRAIKNALNTALAYVQAQQEVAQ